MKAFKIYGLFVGLVMLFTSCKKTYVKSLEFNVTTASATYKVNDTVIFNFSGNPSLITFWSGEKGVNGNPGRQYIYRNRTSTTSAEGTPIFRFQTFGEKLSPLFPNSLSVMLSYNFSGIANKDSIASASWMDITDRFTLSTGANNTPSGEVNLSEFMNNGDTVYIAFKYAAVQNLTVDQPKWTIRNLSLRNYFPDGNYQNIIDTTANAAFTAVDVKGAAVAAQRWVLSAAATPNITGALKAVSEDNEDWIFTKPLLLNYVKPDVGVQIKNATLRLEPYRYIFKTPGTYTVTFVANNTTVFKEDSMVKELTITITP